MDLVKIKEIDIQNIFLHFTKTKNIEQIRSQGLLAKIGENAMGIEYSKKVFFSKGVEGALKIIDVWMKWSMNRQFGYHSLKNQYQGEKLVEKLSEWSNQFITKEYIKDEEKKKVIFNKMFNDMKDSSYLILGLEEGVDFSYNDIDEAKQFCINQKINGNMLTYNFMKEMYGNYSDASTNKLEEWNLHTFSNKNIEKEKISQLTTDSGKKDVTSILVEIYDKYRDKNTKYDLLDDYIQYSKEKMQEKIR